MSDSVEQLGNYRIIRSIGRGGFATVYLGEHVYLKTLAAIKLLQKTTSQEPEKFLREAQTIAKLKHPHIVRVLEFGVDSRLSQHFLVMEYAPSGSLRHLHPRGSILSTETILPYVEQVASALQYAHEQGVVHRDVKPANILVVSPETVILSDFGIAIDAHRTQSLSSQEFAGTCLYTAPEQLRGMARTASDQYALGIVVYEWLCGACPFENVEPYAIMMKHMMEPPPSLRQRVSSIPVRVEEVVLKALAKEPEQRFASVIEFAYALNEACQRPKLLHLKRSKLVPISTPIDSTQVLIPSNDGPTNAASMTHLVLPDGKGIVMEPTLSAASTSTMSAKQMPRRSVVLGLAALTTGVIVASAYSAASRATFPLSLFANGASTAPKSTVTPISKELLHTYLKHPGAPVRRVVWPRLNPNLIASVGQSPDMTVKVWNYSDGDKTLYEFDYYKNLSYYDPLAQITIDWSPDGKLIASTGQDKIVRCWVFNTGEQVFVGDKQKGFVLTLAWSPDGKYIATGGRDGVVSVLDFASRKTIRTYQGHNKSSVHAIINLAWSPDSKYIISGGSDTTAQVWDIRTEHLLFSVDHSSTVSSVSWSPFGNLVASGDEGGWIYIHSFPDGMPIATHQHTKQMPGHSWTQQVRGLAWSPDGHWIASASNDHTIHTWDPHTGKLAHNYDYPGSIDGGGFASVTWSPDGKYLASGDYDHEVCVWKAIV